MPIEALKRYTEGQQDRRRELLKLIEYEKQQCAIRCQPYIDELVKIDSCTPVSYVITDDDYNLIGITKELPNQEMMPQQDQRP